MSSATDHGATVYKHIRQENNLLYLKRKRKSQPTSYITDPFGDIIVVYSMTTKLNRSIYFSGRLPATLDSVETVSISSSRNDYLLLQKRIKMKFENLTNDVRKMNRRQTHLITF